MNLLNPSMCDVYASGLVREEHSTWLNTENLRDNKRKGPDSTRIILYCMDGLKKMRDSVLVRITALHFCGMQVG